MTTRTVQWTYMTDDAEDDDEAVEMAREWVGNVDPEVWHYPDQGGPSVDPERFGPDAADYLDRIHKILDGEVWSPDHLDSIAEVLIESGREIREPGFADDLDGEVEYTVTVTAYIDGGQVSRVAVDDQNLTLVPGQPPDLVAVAEGSEWPAWGMGL